MAVRDGTKRRVEVIGRSGWAVGEGSSNISTELRPVDVALVPDGLEHRMVGRLVDVAVDMAHHSGVVR